MQGWHRLTIALSTLAALWLLATLGLLWVTWDTQPISGPRVYIIGAIGLAGFMLLCTGAWIASGFKK